MQEVLKMNDKEMLQQFIDFALYQYFKTFYKEEFDETNVCSLECISKNQEYKIEIDIQIQKYNGSEEQ